MLNCKIEEKFKDYGNQQDNLKAELHDLPSAAHLLTLSRELASFNPPPKLDYLSLKNYLNHNRQIVDVEEYAEYKDDLVSLKPGREHSWLDVFIERVLNKIFCSAVHVSAGIPSGK